MQYSVCYLVLFIGTFHLNFASGFFNTDFKKCPKGDGAFPKPGSKCKSYYRCQRWRPIEEDCERDHHFDPARESCVRPEDYPCFEKETPCLRPDGKFLKEGTECKEYYSCCSGRPTLKSCPLDQVFDAIRETCEWKEIYICPEAVDREKCPEPFGKFPKAGTACKVYYECRNGIPTEKSCPIDQIFDVVQDKCDWSELSICPEAVDREKCPEPFGKFPKTGTACKVYYECRNGIPTEKSCPVGQIFDVVQGKCDWSELSICPEVYSTTEINTIRTEPSTESTITKKEELSTTNAFSPTDTVSMSTNEATTGTEDTTFETNFSTKTTGTSTVTRDESTTKTRIASVETTEVGTATSTESTNSITSDITDKSTSEPVSTTIDESKTTESQITTETDPGSIITTNEINTATFTGSTNSIITGISKEITLEPTLHSTSISISESTTAEDEIITDTDITLIKTTTNKVNDDKTQSDSTINPSVFTSEVTPRSSQEPREMTLGTKETSTITSSTSTSADTTDFDYSEESEEENGKSKTTKEFTTSGIDETSTPGIFCPEPNGYFPHPTDKHKFVGCVGGDPRVISCPGKLVYVHKKRRCDYEKKSRIMVRAYSRAIFSRQIQYGNERP